MEMLCFPNRRHMPKQQELSKCHPPDTVWNAANYSNNEDNVPICEHLRLLKMWSTINDPGEWESKVKKVWSVLLVSSLLSVSSEAPMLLLPDQTNTAGFFSKHIKKAGFVEQTVAALTCDLRTLFCPWLSSWKEMASLQCFSLTPACIKRARPKKPLRLQN